LGRSVISDKIGNFSRQNRIISMFFYTSLLPFVC
jgi:hypothetical protein